ncbi:ABC transporter permease [Nonomuraea rubra]|uniref:ABC-type transport system involved in multi-copper enzyme maturation permease subunit n=2 Tax=Nonomuraea rubra TaxID=46180 RepID=A0A7X0NVT2_9ACTN|nr:ABC transporter permease [Nonomuraea rubra]MBB6550505.1 ABC-type transport system involved in multi-copper enzyme maturation permease subunit [Nonomuraea rubra]
MLTTVSAEFRKIRTLPSACVAVVAGTAFTLFIVASSARNQAGRLAAGEPTYYASDDLALSLSAPGVIGVIVLGIVIMSSEYTATGKDAGGGRQIPATLTAIPGRARLLAAKAVVLAVLSTLVAAVTIGAAILMTQVILGEYASPPAQLIEAVGWRPAGAVAYWVLTALIAFSVTVVTRSGIVPMVVFIANTTVVSVSFLLTRVTSLARYLPDVAGAQMFATNYPAESMVGPVTGAFVMTGWAAVLLAIAAVVFVRRDA